MHTSEWALSYCQLSKRSHGREVHLLSNWTGNAYEIALIPSQPTQWANLGEFLKILIRWQSIIPLKQISDGMRPTSRPEVSGMRQCCRLWKMHSRAHGNILFTGVWATWDRLIIKQSWTEKKENFKLRLSEISMFDRHDHAIVLIECLSFHLLLLCWWHL